MALLAGQLAGRFDNDLKRHYDAVTGQWYVLQNGVLVPVPYYEATMTWVAGTKYQINHNLQVIPRFVLFQIQAKTAVQNLAVGQREQIIEFTTSTTTYNCSWRKATTTTLEVGVGAAGLSIRQTNEINVAIAAANADLIVQVFGF